MKERWLTRLRRRFRPPRGLTITSVGRVYLVLTVGIGVAALNTGNNLLYLLLGFLLSVIVMSGVLSERALRGLSVRRILPDGAFAGEPFALRYEVRVAEGRALALKITEKDPALDGHAWIPVVGAGEPVVCRADPTAPRRGPLRLRTLEIATTYPLGFFEKSMPVDVDDLLLVFPRRGFVCAIPPSDPRAQAGEAGNPRHRQGTGDLLGLRELEPGEDARRVHWKKSAAAGKLLIVEREREDRRQYTLQVNASLAGAELDQACEETAALAHVLVADGSEVGLDAGGHHLRPAPGSAQERRLLAALAWLGFEGDGGPGDAAR